MKQNSEEKKRWLNPKELEVEYSFSKSTQAKMRMKRQIPFSKVNSMIRYDRYEIDEWIESNKVI